MTATVAVTAMSCASTRPVGSAPPPGGAGAPGAAGGATGVEAEARRWVGTWACGPQLTEPGNLPPAPGLAGNTLRQVVHTSIGGARLRVQLSNLFGDGPVTMQAVHLAVAAPGGGVAGATDVALAFGGARSVTIPAGQVVSSDELDYPLAALTRMALTIHFGAVPAAVTGHPGARTTSYLVAGDAVASPVLAAPATAEHWYYATGIDVLAPAGSTRDGAAASAVVILGDSLTDGRGSTTDHDDRWPDGLSRRLRAFAPTANVAVLNLGIGGNAVTSGGLGPTAAARFQRDVLDQRGARHLIVLEGVNDIGAWPGDGAEIAARLIAAFGAFIDQAHARGIRAYGVPILPFGGSHYDSPEHERARGLVNDWIRTGGRFDAVIDLDRAVRDPRAPARLAAAYDGGDHLHLNPAGYQAMADAVDLSLFAARTYP